MASTLILIVKKIYIAIVRKFCFSETCFSKNSSSNPSGGSVRSRNPQRYDHALRGRFPSYIRYTTLMLKKTK